MITLVIIAIIVLFIVFLILYNNGTFKKCHHKWGKIQEDGYQYCENCNKAIAPPKRECEHRWRYMNDITISESRRSMYTGEFLNDEKDKIYLFRCEECGVMKKESLMN